MYRKIHKQSTRWADDINGLCVVAALNCVGKLCSINNFVHVEDIPLQCMGGLKYSDLKILIEKCNIRIAKVLRMKLCIGGGSIRAWKQGNLIKQTTGGYFDVAKHGVGVYLCAATSRKQIGHMFVVEVQSSLPQVHDSANSSTCLYDTEYCKWIHSWQFCMRCTLVNLN